MSLWHCFGTFIIFNSFRPADALDATVGFFANSRGRAGCDRRCTFTFDMLGPQLSFKKANTLEGSLVWFLAVNSKHIFPSF